MLKLERDLMLYVFMGFYKLQLMDQNYFQKKSLFLIATLFLYFFVFILTLSLLILCIISLGFFLRFSCISLDILPIFEFMRF